MNKKQVDIENASTFRDSLLISLIFSNIAFVIIFLLFFIKTNDTTRSLKFSFIVSFIIFIAFSILIYIYLDTVLENRIKEIENFNQSFDNGKQKELEDRQKQILETIARGNIFSKNVEKTIANDDSISNKKINPDVKTQFNLDFENNIQDLSKKMDM